MFSWEELETNFWYSVNAVEEQVSYSTQQDTHIHIPTHTHSHSTTLTHSITLHHTLTASLSTYTDIHICTQKGTILISTHKHTHTLVLNLSHTSARAQTHARILRWFIIFYRLYSLILVLHTIIQEALQNLPGFLSLPAVFTIICQSGYKIRETCFQNSKLSCWPSIVLPPMQLCRLNLFNIVSEYEWEILFKITIK